MAKTTWSCSQRHTFNADRSKVQPVFKFEKQRWIVPPTCPVCVAIANAQNYPLQENPEWIKPEPRVTKARPGNPSRVVEQ